MQPQEHHQMVIAETYPSGAEEWYCPTCGYRFLMQWPPQYKKIMLNEGDPHAIHSGGSGGIQMDVAEMKTNDPASPEAIEENTKEISEPIDQESLEPWMDFLEDLNIPDELDSDTPKPEE